ncbi:MAG: hypothetical protein M1476_02075 [Candidatus Thermoplasmatota archaeon]|nr:hypothetical protein [Candidatus Thermoplasmatota archaeon]
MLRVRVRSEDRAVAEVVGAILLFAVFITLFTSFLVWYIPTTTGNNEALYQHQTGSAFNSLVGKIHSGNLITGSTVSQNIPLGINGAEVRSKSVNTQVSVIPKYQDFNASVTFSLSIGVKNSTSSTSIPINGNYTTYGIMNSLGNTEYVSPVNYQVEDGSLFQIYGTSQPSNILGPLPLGISKGSGGLGLQLGIYGFNGSSVTISASQPQIINLLVNSTGNTDYINGSLASISNQIYTIQNITLNSLKYSINGSLVNAWDYGFFNQFNNSGKNYTTVLSLPSWNFSAYNLMVHYSGSNVYITSKSPMKLNSVGVIFEYLKVS